jgi:hypothetical protein
MISYSYEESTGYAHECVRLAGLTGEQTVRDQILELARGWLTAALNAPRKSRAVGCLEGRVIMLPPRTSK